MARQIEFYEHGGSEVLQYVEYTPNSPAPGEVQIQNRAIGLNYIDIYVRSGLYPPLRLPAGMGCEAAGVVARVGKGVAEFKEGDRVVYAQSALGAYSEIHNVPAAKVARLPPEISFEQAAASFLKGLTVRYLLTQTYPVRPGETFLFHAAAGGVGHIACQWARAIEAKLIGTVGSAAKADRAIRDGAWAVINYREESVPQRMLELTGGEKVSVVYGSVGKGTWEVSLECLPRRGLMVSFGNASGPVTGVNLGILNHKGSLFVTRPALNGYITNRQELDEACRDLFSMISSGRINVDVPPEQQFALRDPGQAHQMLQSRQTQGACLLLP